MRTLTLILLSLLAIQTISPGQEAGKPRSEKKIVIQLYDDGTWQYADTTSLAGIVEPVKGLEIPKLRPEDQVISHTAYSLLFSDQHRQARWIAYELTKEETEKSVERTDKFKPDPDVKGGTATDKDYEGSGYDRGHLAPAADMGWSPASMAESFYYSNMSPQVPAFNRGIWKKLEELVRNWAGDYEAIYVVTGPVLNPGLNAIGPNKVSVPGYFYKVILDSREQGYNGIGFILPNSGSSLPLQSFAVTIDSVEKFTGIDFFPALPDKQERQIEKTLCIDCWNWKYTRSVNQNDAREKSGDRASASVQCSGKTKAGDRCENNTLEASGYCYLHESQANSNTNTPTGPAVTERRSVSVQCSGTTQAGNRCKRKTLSANGHCWQHGGN